MIAIMFEWYNSENDVFVTCNKYIIAIGEVLTDLSIDDCIRDSRKKGKGQEIDDFEPNVEQSSNINCNQTRGSIAFTDGAKDWLKRKVFVKLISQVGQHV